MSVAGFCLRQILSTPLKLAVGNDVRKSFLHKTWSEMVLATLESE
jgi:hypothetical protein